MPSEAGPVAPNGAAPIRAAPAGRAAGWAGLDVLVLAPTPTHPMNAGNRRRIFFVNDALRRRGARITYVHYPAEGDWRTGVPDGAMQAMSRQWHASHIVPVTRTLHDAPRGEDHAIDEWWDPAIGEMLRWLFRTHRFDVLIVNYAWLSKAFEFCPRGVLKILDTHDCFSGRRALLGRHGIAPEFFHTTVEQERIALDRADLVWAIKPHEAALFRTMTSRLVVDLPHIEPVALQPRRPARDGVLRFGIAGAANSINLANIRAFLAEAEATIRSTLLPCELVIGGSICDLLGDVRQPWVRLMGRLDDMAEFYAAVDVVLAPVAFSTGLKIKVGEALCQGRAVVGLHHAFEGYEAVHPFHRLRSVAAMLRACRRIVNDPGLIDELEQASLRSVMQAQAAVARGLDDSIAERWRIERGVCIVVDAADLHPGGLVVDHVRETAQYIGNLMAVSVFVHGGADMPDPGALRGLAEMATLVTTPELQAALGRDGTMRSGIGPLRVRSLARVLRDPHYAVWFASCPGAWQVPATPRPGRAYVACDSVLQSTAPEAMPGFLARLRGSFAEVVLLSRRDLAGLGRPEFASWSHRLPMLWRGERSLVVPDLRAGDGEAVFVLAADCSDPLLAMVVELTRRLSSRPVVVVLPDRLMPPEGAGAVAARLRAGTDPAAVGAPIPLRGPTPVPHRAAPGQAGPLDVVPATRCFSAARPWLVLVMATDLALEAAREAFDHAGVPMADLCVTATAPAHGAWVEPAGAAGLFESMLLVEELLTRPGAVGQLRARRSAARNRTNDAGWAWIWSELSGLADQRGNAAGDRPDMAALAS